MKTRMLRNEGLVVYELGLGCMGTSEFYGRTDEPAAVVTRRRAHRAIAGERNADMSSVGV